MDRNFVIVVAKAVKKLRNDRTPYSIINAKDVKIFMSGLDIPFSSAELRNALLFLHQQGCFSTSDLGTPRTPEALVSFQLGDFDEILMKRWTS